MSSILLSDLLSRPTSPGKISILYRDPSVQIAPVNVVAFSKNHSASF